MSAVSIASRSSGASGVTLLGLPATKDGLLGVLVCLTTLWLLAKLLVAGLAFTYVLTRQDASDNAGTFTLNTWDELQFSALVVSA